MTNGKDQDAQPDELRRAEQRVRQEMARQRRAEEAHLRNLKFGCIGIIAFMLLAMVIAFFF
ncbi:MAG: hypothetical protein HYU41_24780 [Candidatus Rokubacteria bacterium]|nr:hypothetical protein [Candidatus Rokubacteria bacterium]